MLSAYSWGQFGLFILALVILYYLVVGLLFYRSELTALLRKGQPGSGPQLAGMAAAASGSAVPALVRPTSAFAPAPPTAGNAPADQAPDEAELPQIGAADNLPAASQPVVAGELPPSTATATGQDESASEAEFKEATAAAATRQPEAQVQDVTRRDEDDQVDERLAALVRQEASESSEVLEPQPVVFESVVSGYEPLATFEEPVASLLDIITAEPSQQLVAAESVSEYIALLQAGQNPPVPAALQGSCLAEQMAQHLEQYNAELAALFEADEA